MSYATQRQIPELIRKRQPFEGSNMSAISYDDLTGEGSPSWIDAGMADTAPPAGCRYIIWSYKTPIAWIDREGYAVVLDQKFSQTTTQHQSLVRRGLQHDPDAQERVTLLAKLDELALASVYTSLGVTA